MSDAPTAELIECVPNISEGRDAAALAACRAAIVARADVHLLHEDVGADAHRTVFTFAGAPEAVGDAAIRLGHAVALTVDMRRHHGAHPRIGALDVCPFVPLRSATLARCAAVARRVASTLAHDLEVPVYLYEAAAFRADRRDLPGLRAGGYEGLTNRLRTPDGLPDFGPARVSPRLGAAVVGARPFLVAWNVSLDTADVTIARRIASRLRSASPATGARPASSPPPARRLPAVRAIGWAMPAYGCAQVSMNILDHTVTPLHVAFDAVSAEARREGVSVTGSELIGLVPAAALLAAGRTVAAADADDDACLAAAVGRLGLDRHGPFDLDARVVERRLGRALAEPHATIAG